MEKILRSQGFVGAEIKICMGIKEQKVKTFSDVTYTHIAKTGRATRKTKTIVHTYCPFCGKSYE
jgi:hypothetical protein